MRVTPETKQATDAAIRKAGRRLFTRQGFDATSTRDIAAAAGIASGTLFNYYPTKEALALDLIAEALDESLDTFRATLACSPIPTLEESLFALIAAGLRNLKPLRPAIGQVLEAGLSPFATSVPPAAARMRTAQLEQAAALLAHHGVPDPSAVTMHLYWTLYLGVLSFWAADQSPKQEDTLVLLDEAVRMFAASLRRTTPPPTKENP